MANVIDYLNWRGDIPFDRDPLNKIDAVIFACLSYVNFGGVVPEDGMISIRDACDRFMELHTEEELKADKSFFSSAPDLLKTVAATERFGHLMLSDYADHTDIEDMVQFAAVTIHLSPDELFISFRGTDDTIVGWKEDFYLSYMTVSAEKESIEYLDMIASKYDSWVIMGGHSKGGHLSIYSASRTSDETRSRIVGIYDFDGPGFKTEMKESRRFRVVESRIVRVIPENSIIGRLLLGTTDPIIVASTQKGVMQHDPLSWEIMGKEFVTLEKNTVASDVFDMTLTTWIDNLEPDAKKQFIDDVFSVLEASGETNISAVASCGLGGVKKMLARIKTIDKGSREQVKLLMRIFIDNWGVVWASYRQRQAALGKSGSKISFVKMITSGGGNDPAEVRTNESI